MLRAEDVIRLLNLQPHPIEGGHFRETHRSGLTLPGSALPGHRDDRSASTAIYYLLTPGAVSEMHQLPGEELFHYYAGDPLETLLLYPDGRVEVRILGIDFAPGQERQLVIPPTIGKEAHPPSARTATPSSVRRWPPASTTPTMSGEPEDHCWRSGPPSSSGSRSSLRTGDVVTCPVIPFRRLLFSARTTMIRSLLAIGLLALALPAVAAQERLTKVEIGKRGKAATAFVEVPKVGTGTAFCIHPSGLFITNEHVVRGAHDEVILVLNPSLEGQRVLKAKVVRTDKVLDLALLRVEGEKDLPSLPLGSIKGVAELSEVVACGFPLGFSLSTDKKEYPAISVNAGSVTALRYKERVLESLQIDITLTFGNSGGPVLDENGQVVGVVVRGLSGVGKGINQAIPVSLLEGFLNKPDIAFAAPQLTRETLEKPLEFKASVVSFAPKAPEATLKLILQTGDETPASSP